MNKYPLLSKTLVIGFLMLLLGIPLMMVQGVVSERARFRDAASNDVAASHAGAQTVAGPVLWVPYTEQYPEVVRYGKNNEDTREEIRTRSGVEVVFPTSLDTKAVIKTEKRYRGIFPVTVFVTESQAVGRLVWKGVKPQEERGRIVLGQPQILMGVSDLRGLLSAPHLQIGENILKVSQALPEWRAPLPLAAALPVAQLETDKPMDFSLKIDVAGTQSVGWIPLADDNRVSVESPWPHPSFVGRFLPRERLISDSGFKAIWQVPSLSTRAQQQFLRAGGEANAFMESFSVALNEPVDVYHLSERATKYGSLFIVLTFVGFFVQEMVRRWRIHPMQYLMVGASLVVFFLLLVSLSEHIAFVQAYGVASAACVALLSYYLRHVLGNWKAGLGAGTLFAALYGILLGILMSEDNALMMGALLVFGVLALVMVATRKVDWYGVMKSSVPSPAVVTKPSVADAALPV